MKIPGLAMVIPGIMFSSIVDISNTDIVPGQTRQEEQAAAVRQANAVPRDPEIVTALVYQGRYLDAMDLQGRTTLMWAAEHGETALVERLLLSGADVNTADWWGRTALSLALENDHRKISALRSEHGANITAG
ncbi:MAG TPA: ankyrin repeat domain-containing protein [Magnetococcales bacterium]|nr:ankyrin repeat domain-containing protein [Magnetococcales bacterium]